MKRPEGFDPRVEPTAPERKRRAPRVTVPRAEPKPRPTAKATTSKTSTSKITVPKNREPKAGAPREPAAPPQRPETKAAKPKNVDRRARAEVRKAARERRRYEKGEVRRFTRRARHRRAAWLSVGAVVVLLGGLLAVAVYSPLLALREIRIVGTARVDAAQLRDAIDGQLGTPLALLDHKVLRDELGAFPLIRSYVTELVPPGTLIVSIVERQPVGALAAGGAFEVVDPAGIVVESAAERPAGVPLIDVGAQGSKADGFAAVVEVLLALPEAVRTQVDSATATTKDDVTLTLAGTANRVVWGSADRSDLKARVLAQLMAAQPGATLEYDVSAPLSPVVRPA